MPAYLTPGVYIEVGETEKNLHRIFDTAESRDCILFFDEADSLFGKRTEVKDAHDRYANMEVSYLLAHIESYRGLCIITSNHHKHLDPEILRHFRMLIEFPRSDMGRV